MLEDTFQKEDEFRITGIETLCSDGCVELGNLWDTVTRNGYARIRLDDLLDALSHADQIVTLYMHVAGDRERLLVIEDGEAIENNLSKPENTVVRRRD